MATSTSPAVDAAGAVAAGAGIHAPAAPTDSAAIVARRAAAARATGAKLYGKWAPVGPHDSFCQITAADVASCGGRDAWVAIFIEFYRRMTTDPILKQLFDRSDPDVDVPAEEHGWRFGMWMLARYGGVPEYMAKRGGHIFGNIGRAHTRATRCPMRPAAHRGRGFTVRQRDTWLGYQHQACVCKGVPDAVRSKLMGLHAGYGFAFIGPFEDLPHPPDA